MFEILKWIASNIFGEPFILIGAIVFVGLLLQKKSVNDLVGRSVKAMIGFLIISAGAGVIVSSLLIFQPLWQEVFNLPPQDLGTFLGQDKSLLYQCQSAFYSIFCLQNLQNLNTYI